jgi:hypothetical protein
MAPKRKADADAEPSSSASMLSSSEVDDAAAHSRPAPASLAVVLAAHDAGGAAPLRTVCAALEESGRNHGGCWEKPTWHDEAARRAATALLAPLGTRALAAYLLDDGVEDEDEDEGSGMLFWYLCKLRGAVKDGRLGLVLAHQAQQAHLGVLADMLRCGPGTAAFEAAAWCVWRTWRCTPPASLHACATGAGRWRARAPPRWRR